MPTHDQSGVQRHALYLPISPCFALFWGVITAMLASTEARASTESMMFDLGAFTSDSGSTVDMSRFNKSSVMMPGTYRMDVLVNGQGIGRTAIAFVSIEQQESAIACFDRTLLAQWGVDLSKLDDTKNTAPSATAPIPQGPLCGPLGQWIPMASSTVDAETLQLSINVPQLYMARSARGYVDPSQWDDGISAGLLSYNFSTSSTLRGSGDDRVYMGFNSGLNLGSWRFRHQGAQGWSSDSGANTYQNTATYVQRSLPAWKSQLTLGDSFSSGQILDSLRLRGASLATDDRMLPQSQQGYAPIVRGVAQSNATVRISQSNYTLYETTVAPGPFVIDDLYPTGFGGDLTVSVTEIDGRKNTFIVPFSITPQLLRSGSTKYSTNLGQVQQRGLDGDEPLAFQGTLQQGLSDRFTLYGGTTLAQGYGQAKAGLAMSTSIGAFSLDTTHSRARISSHGTLSGQNFGIAYNKHWVGSGTNIVLGAYRFSTDGYLTLIDTINVNDQVRRGHSVDSYARQKNRLDITLSQKIGDGTLSLYGSSVEYWGAHQGRQTSYTLGYGSTWGKLNWNLSAQRSRVEDTRELTSKEQSDDVFFGPRGTPGRLDNRLMLTLSVPLGSTSRAPSISSTLSRNTGDNRGTQQQVSLSGIWDDQGDLNYGLSANRNTGEGGTSGNFNAYTGYRINAANLRAGYGQSNDSSQLSFSADGGLIAHSGGVTLSQNLGEAVALVHVPNAEGARVGNENRVDAQGYAVVSSVRAFQPNVISIDPNGTAYDVELKESTQTTVPTLGAVSLLTFETVSGRAVVLKVSQKNGKPLPFAAQVFDEQGAEVGVIGQASKAFVRGIADQGSLLVKWGSHAFEQCTVTYQLPPQTQGQRQVSADFIEGECVKPTEP